MKVGLLKVAWMRGDPASSPNAVRSWANSPYIGLEPLC